MITIDTEMFFVVSLTLIMDDDDENEAFAGLFSWHCINLELIIIDIDISFHFLTRNERKKKCWEEIRCFTVQSVGRERLVSIDENNSDGNKNALATIAFLFV